jgi:hypothetical protein
MYLVEQHAGLTSTELREAVRRVFETEVGEHHRGIIDKPVP